MKSNNKGIGQTLDEQTRFFAIQDMLDQEYEPMIELNRQLEMVMEDGDWGEEMEKEIRDRIEVLWKTWYLLTISKQQLSNEQDSNKKYTLLLKIGIYHQQNENLTDLSIPIGIYPSEKEMKYIIKWVNEELMKNRI